MNIKDFPDLNAVGASMRSGEALIAVALDEEWQPGKPVRGALSIYESGEDNGRWLIAVREDGAIEQRSDDFYRAVELFSVMRRDTDQG